MSFLTVCLQPIAENRVVRSWDSTAMNLPITELNKVFIFKQFRRERFVKFVCILKNRVKYFSDICCFLCLISSFITADNGYRVDRRQSYPIKYLNLEVKRNTHT